MPIKSTMSIIGERSIPRRFMAPGTFLLGTVIYGMLGYTVLIPGTGSVVSPDNISGGQMAKLESRAHADA